MKILIDSNIVLNLWFVWGLHLGVAGSGCAIMFARMFADWTVRGIIYWIWFKNRKWLNHQVIS